MILQRLTALYDRMSADGEAAPPGFQRKAVHFVVVLDTVGRAVGLERTGSIDERGRHRPRDFVVPQEEIRTVAAKANLLWDNAEYALGLAKSPELADRAKERHRLFIERTASFKQATASDLGIEALTQFLETQDADALSRFDAFPDLRETNGNVAFRLDGDPELICERPLVREIVAQMGEREDDGVTGQCLVTGTADRILNLHPAIKGVRGAQTAGARLVSFNLDAFTSHGAKQNQNAPVGQRAAFAYTAALNNLLAERPNRPRRKLVEGDTTYVFWAAQANTFEDDLALLFDTPPTFDSLTDSVRALFAAIRTGTPPQLSDQTQFYILGLAPNAARIAVRFWHEGTVAEIAGNVLAHFRDIDLATSYDRPPSSLRYLLRSLAVAGNDDNLPANLAGEVVRAVLSGGQYPRTLLVSAVTRCRAEQDVTHSRAALIKGVLVRNARLGGHSEQEVSVTLDIEDRNAGYRLGRLFAVLERIQETAQPGINATIRDRFYGAASSTPVVAFPHLLKLHNHHIAKFRDEKAGLANWFEKQIGEIM
ncbi:MAG TPA: type I-C CRISPR-associated protein Cas8c/Csd1, partial [Bradyrhizobium sp.]|nr:type I-C CRISPR-associated protein Cas8c/Csd1 [Bradyrhizobium sp.]